MALGLCLLTGCSKSSVKIEMDKKEYETDGYKITMEIPSIKTDIPYQTQFNSDYLKISDEIFNNFSKESEKSDTPKDQLTMEQEIKLNKNNILSIVGHIEAFTGGSQNQLFRIAKNIDLENQKELSFSDLFTDEEYKIRINAYIETKMKEDPNEFSSLWKVPKVVEDQEFYLSPKGVVIYFPPYELSYYARGFIDFTIPYEEVRKYMKDEYREYFI